jgi:anaerobic magnesium-protoporphyrin IX monomethyl ester cyclase
VRVALVNPPWSFEGSIYFGCREPHLPLELGYAKALIEEKGHEARIFDAQLFAQSLAELQEEVAAFSPEMTAVTTAPSYLFWRCAPPELRVPRETLRALRGVAGRTVAVGPHASTTPAATLRKLGVDAAVIGECEEALAELASCAFEDWDRTPSVACRSAREDAHTSMAPRTVPLDRLPALRWEARFLERHRHHHHRFDRPPEGMGAEVEASRGCPYHCTFCAKNEFRDRYRRRPLSVLLSEIDGLIEQGVRYLYFIDEIFLPDAALLEALAGRSIEFGVQMRIDNWSPEMLDLLGRAGCVSIEAGVESLTEVGRSLLAKKCRITTGELTRLLIHAKKNVPFVQANLLDAGTDDPEEVRTWREHLHAHGVWANEPVPMFPYPGSPDYVKRWGKPDDGAWERAHAAYLARYSAFSDLQDQLPLPLHELEERS